MWQSKTTHLTCSRERKKKIPEPHSPFKSKSFKTYGLPTRHHLSKTTWGTFKTKTTALAEVARVRIGFQGE
jgi:hypothetical protein